MSGFIDKKNRPLCCLSFVGGQALHAFSFLPEAYFGREDLWQQLGFILDDRSQVEKLLVRLEELAKSR